MKLSTTMTEKQFIDWLRGFTQGVHHYNLTPKQWDYLKEKLSEVGTNQDIPYIIENKHWYTSVS